MLPQLTGGVSKGLALLTMDQEYVNRFRVRSVTLRQRLLQGLQAAGVGLYEGFLGTVLSPISCLCSHPCKQEAAESAHELLGPQEPVYGPHSIAVCAAWQQKNESSGSPPCILLSTTCRPPLCSLNSEKLRGPSFLQHDYLGGLCRASLLYRIY